MTWPLSATPRSLQPGSTGETPWLGCKTTAVLWTATAKLQILRQALLVTGEPSDVYLPDLVVTGLLYMAYLMVAGMHLQVNLQTVVS